MPLMEPKSCDVIVDTGTMGGATGRYEKRLSQLTGLYEDASALSALIDEMGDPVAYDVCEFRPSEASGDMIFGLTRMSPGCVGREFFFTRGHIHARTDRPEVYYGQKGHGLMQLEAPDGETKIVEINPQTICYVPPFWIHRSINTGKTDLVMMFSYPADSGQNYGIIERSGGLRYRVIADPASGWHLVENPNYAPRSPTEVKSILESIS